MLKVDFDAALAPLEPKNTAAMPLFRVKVNSKLDVVLLGNHAGQLNGKYQSLVAKLTKKHSAELSGEDTPARRQLSNELFAKALAMAAITDWQNVCDRDGKTIPYSAEACEEFLIALQKKRPDIAAIGGAIDVFFSNANNFCDGYGGDAEALGEG